MTSPIIITQKLTASELPARTSRARSWPAFLREPLLHFVVLGALLFAVDHFLFVRSDDPRTIVVGADVDQEASEVFASARGRKPTAEELRSLRQSWLDNEVLYREGLDMRLDRGDSAIRDRVIFKALSVVDAATTPPRADEKDVRHWFDTHRDLYDEPARFDFEEATLTGPRDESSVRALVAAINSGTQGDVKAGLQIFKGRPRGNLVTSYGPEFAKALEDAPVGEWRAYATGDGWRAMRLDAIVPARPASFEAVQPAVRQDWIDAELAAQRTAAVRAMVRKYKVRYAGDAR